LRCSESVHRSTVLALGRGNAIAEGHHHGTTASTTLASGTPTQRAAAIATFTASRGQTSTYRSVAMQTHTEQQIQAPPPEAFNPGMPLLVGFGGGLLLCAFLSACLKAYQHPVGNFCRKFNGSLQGVLVQ